MSSVNQNPLQKHFQRREHSEHKWHFFNSHFYVFFWYFSFPKSKLGFFMDIKIQNINDIFFNSWNLDGKKKRRPLSVLWEVEKHVLPEADKILLTNFSKYWRTANENVLSACKYIRFWASWMVVWKIKTFRWNPIHVALLVLQTTQIQNIINGIFF